MLPPNARLWIRLPNWLGDVIMALPLIRAIKVAQPDIEITLVAQAHFIPFLEMLDAGDSCLPLPKKGSKGYYKYFRQFRGTAPDCYLLFTNSLRGDLEAWHTGCRQRISMVRPGKWRPLLTTKWKVPADLDESQVHQMSVWEQMLQSFKLGGPLDLTTIPLADSGQADAPPTEGKVIGLICGTENDPSKRWPIARWRELIKQIHTRWPEVQIKLFGTARDAQITQQVAAGMAEHVEDVAGKTDLIEFTRALSRCALLVSNDTGGMHIANALGVPAIGIFGPTNPVRTGPVFTAPVTILQPEGCPKTGGAAIDGVRVETVLKHLAAALP